MIEFTVAMIKSHVADQMTVVNDVLREIYEQDLVIACMRREVLALSQVNMLYQEHWERPYYPALVASVTARPVWIMILSGHDAIRRWRAALGPTNPKLARETAPKSLRACFGGDNVVADNVGHGSDSEQAARREIGILFPWVWSDGLRSQTRAAVPPVRSDDSAAKTGDGHL